MTNTSIQPAPNPTIPGVADTGLTRNQIDQLVIGRPTSPVAAEDDSWENAVPEGFSP